MFVVVVDVTSLPGGWNSNKGVLEEMFTESQKIVQLTSIVLASSNGTASEKLRTAKKFLNLQRNSEKARRQSFLVPRGDQSRALSSKLQEKRQPFLSRHHS
jgi:hypothetical protein